MKVYRLIKFYSWHRAYILQTVNLSKLRCQLFLLNDSLKMNLKTNLSNDPDFKFLRMELGCPVTHYLYMIGCYFASNQSLELKLKSPLHFKMLCDSDEHDGQTILTAFLEYGILREIEKDVYVSDFFIANNFQMVSGWNNGLRHKLYTADKKKQTEQTKMMLEIFDLAAKLKQEEKIDLFYQFRVCRVDPAAAKPVLDNLKKIESGKIEQPTKPILTKKDDDDGIPW